ncbi:Aerobic-type carbon monoxide dehydrogenase, middle subunit CoxM/CutM-like protein [Roseovarius mucosus DSM 17069]|uniref:Aerobic-type carbon monoxide dehydrogenase, middle subunit CoxM/CutM-like protein n=1 Tax=Roseovarius mucosus DSM 17069 TaxID=1288298 RepID=A0A0A0HDY2_9RHOB|nr:xanthine dehydrogenase family protein subunit M [Roseovarius mucosus]KGM85907.1 Aerobic-type carbon monoxide dehydrogenase, middle subunit CoxM/CutM-like protein [Roseovarius mucosus DSM 17069]
MQPISYARPASLASAISTLAAGGASTRVLAGGTTLYDLMKLDVEQPERIVDINNLGELAAFDTSGDELVFGALARMSDVSADARLTNEFPALSEALWKAASQQLRNMASLGGNLLQRTRCAYFRHGAPFACNKRSPGSGCAAIEGLNRGHALFGGSDACIATYPGDFAVALVAFDAQIDIAGPDGERTIPLSALHRQPGDNPRHDTILLPEEIIVRIRVPADIVGRASTYHKIRDRESYAFAVVSAAAAVRFEAGVVADARLALGGVATVPWRAREAERSLLGKPLTPETARAAGELAFTDAATRQHDAFKVELGANVVRDALLIASGRF